MAPLALVLKLAIVWKILRNIYFDRLISKFLMLLNQDQDILKAICFIFLFDLARYDVGNPLFGSGPLRGTKSTANSGA